MHQPPDSARQPRRRQVLKAGLGAATLFTPFPYAKVWAQTPLGARLLRLPKVALIIGNSQYKGSPLKNPANDAKAMQSALSALGFAVTLKLDAAKVAMDDAIKAYVETLARNKGVGLFYYAGHGIQVAWKNYLLAVDTSLDSLDAVVKQSVELNALIGGLTKAGNPMNLIMLDACRDNPFGAAKGPEQKGLSQMDAPLNTLLAYATAPGNTASDGEGSNGLYTEHLLREMQVKEAKVEDVFKRVRLGVRRKSNGAQIPWESTSLEDDFFFNPPATLVQQAEEERKRAFEEELKLWESIQAATVPEPLEGYLRRYPSGQFSELAQLQLDRVLAKAGEKAVQIVSAKDNPFTKGSARTDTAYQVGDTYSYRLVDMGSGKEMSRPTLTVTKITDSEVVFNDGVVTTDLLGNTTRFPDGRRPTGNQTVPTVFEVGRRWTTRFRLVTPDGRLFDNEVQFHIQAKENIVVPAGSFDCFRYEGVGFGRGPGMRFQNLQVNLTFRVWMAPELCRRAIKMETIRQVLGGPLLDNERRELLSFKQG